MSLKQSLAFLVGVSVALGVLLPAGVARGDSWALPGKAVYRSASAKVRFTVVPAPIGSQLDYFEAKVKGKAPKDRARGRLEHRQPDGRWVLDWEKPLVNEVAPVDALVADDGSAVVTFDDWHFSGTSPNTVVIYGRGGAVVRVLALTEILPAEWIEALPHSVSSMRWRGEHRLSPDGKRLILVLLVPDARDQDRFVERSVDIAAGTFVEDNEAAWRAALSKAAQAATQQAAEARAYRKWWNDPLVAPAGSDEAEWHKYLGEVFFRSDPDWQEGYPSVQVLRSPARADYAASEKWLREALQEAVKTPGTLALASPADPANLVQVLAKVVPGLPSGSLRSSRLYLAVPADMRGPAESALARTAVKVIWVDPNRPIPQRPERRLEGPPKIRAFAG